MAAGLFFRTTGYVTAQGVRSMGGACVRNGGIYTATMNNLFDSVSVSDADYGVTEYRALDILNLGDVSACGVEYWLGPQPDVIVVSTGVDPNGVDHPTQTLWLGQTIPNEITAPLLVTFLPYSTDFRLSLADISAQHATRIWLKRYVPAGTGNKAIESIRLCLRYA
jgi:hypothetical protein